MNAATSAVLDENLVVQHVVASLKRAKWNVSSFATTGQAGVDIVADRGGRRLYVEAKGVTSSKPTSNRYGQVQTSSQVFISVAPALLKTAEMRSEHPDADIAIAVPAHSAMQRRVQRIEPVLRSANIGLLWVGSDGKVEAWNLKVLEPTSKR